MFKTTEQQSNADTKVIGIFLKELPMLLDQLYSIYLCWFSSEDQRWYLVSNNDIGGAPARPPDYWLPFVLHEDIVNLEQRREQKIEEAPKWISKKSKRKRLSETLRD